MRLKNTRAVLAGLIAACTIACPAPAQDAGKISEPAGAPAEEVDTLASVDPEAPLTLITNVDVFDGFADEVATGMNVLVQGNAITEVSSEPIEAAGATVIDGTGKTMTPGLIDMHQHLMLFLPEGTAAYQTRWDDAAGGAMALQGMNDHLLMKGFTTVRDIAGDPLDVAKAIDMGLLRGPRIYSSGGAISQIGGHGDWAGRNVPPELLNSHMDMTQRTQNSWSVSGPDEVTQAVRHNFRRGAAFIKVMGGGGVASEFDPLEIMGLASDEVARAVEIAADNGTYVATHAYHDASYNRLLDLGVRSFEHGFLVTEPTVERMAGMGQDIVWSFQCAASVGTFGSYESMPGFFTHEQKLKGVRVGKGALKAAALMQKHGVFTISGSDYFTSETLPRVKDSITCEVGVGYTPAEALQHWTGNAGIVLKWSGPKDPYPTYALGTIKKGAYADLLQSPGGHRDHHR
jgi:imidazolonepropionase-like amidohydrolase